MSLAGLLPIYHLKWKWSRSVVSPFCYPLNCSLSGLSVHGIFQARVLEWVAISFSRGSSQPRDWTQVSCIAGRCFTVWALQFLVFFFFSSLEALTEEIVKFQHMCWPEWEWNAGLVLGRERYRSSCHVLDRTLLLFGILGFCQIDLSLHWVV